MIMKSRSFTKIIAHMQDVAKFFVIVWSNTGHFDIQNNNIVWQTDDHFPVCAQTFPQPFSQPIFSVTCACFVCTYLSYIFCTFTCVLGNFISGQRKLNNFVNWEPKVTKNSIITYPSDG